MQVQNGGKILIKQPAESPESVAAILCQLLEKKITKIDFAQDESLLINFDDALSLKLIAIRKHNVQQPKTDIIRSLAAIH